jgi:hypothetical protein
MADWKLKYVIDGDNRGLKTAVKESDSLLGKLGMSASSGLAALGGPAGVATLAAGAVTAIGTAAISTGVALFNLTKQASDFGSEIFDASKKTGLSAEALSSMKFAADQSGSSMEAVTGSVAKFAKAVGAAAEDAQKGEKFFRDFGLTPQEAIADLDGALAKVFKRIQDAPAGIERMTLAQKAFGRAGADLLPFLDSFDGDLSSLIKKAKELGVTIDDDAARAADEFGDQLDTLSAQFGGVARTIGTAFMPQFLEMAKATSEWAVRNKDEITTWADAFSASVETAVKGTKGIVKELLEWKAVQQWLMLNALPAMALDYATGFSKERERILADRKQQASGSISGLGKTFGGSDDDIARRVAGGGRTGTGKGLAGSDLFKYFEKELGLDVTSAGRTPGRKVAGTGKVSLHSVNPYQAVDVKVNDIKGFMQAGNSEMFERVAKAIDAGFRFVEERDKKGSPHGHFESRKDGKASTFDSIHTGKNYFNPDQLAYLKKLDADRVGKNTGQAKFAEFKADQTKQELEAQEELEAGFKNWIDEMIQAEQDASDKRIAIRRLESEIALDILEGQLEQGILTERQAFETMSDLRLKDLEDERDELEKRVEYEGKSHDLRMLDLAIAKQIIATERTRNKPVSDRISKLKSWNDYVRGLQAQGDADAAKDSAEDGWRVRGESEAGSVTAPGTWGAGIAGGTGTDLVSIWKEGTDAMGNATTVMMSQAEVMKAIYADVADFAGNAIGGMVEGLTQMAIAWIVTGEGSAKAALQMMASTALSIAFQAGIKAIFEAAESVAAFARYDFAAGTAHAAAATMYSSVAVIAGAAGVGLALGARAMGGGKGGGKDKNDRDVDAPQSAYASNGNRNPDPFSRTSQNAFHSGRDAAIQGLSRAVQGLEQKIDGVSPGDILVKGAAQQRGFIGHTVVKEARSDASIGKGLMKSGGMRTTG